MSEVTALPTGPPPLPISKFFGLFWSESLGSVGKQESRLTSRPLIRSSALELFKIDQSSCFMYQVLTSWCHHIKCGIKFAVKKPTTRVCRIDQIKREMSFFCQVRPAAYFSSRVSLQSYFFPVHKNEVVGSHPDRRRVINFGRPIRSEIFFPRIRRCKKKKNSRIWTFSNKLKFLLLFPKHRVLFLLL